jgi:DNA repair protein RadA/Sms
LQIADYISHQLPNNKRVLYVSAEESAQQIAMRVKRLKSGDQPFDKVDVMNEANLSLVLDSFNLQSPHGALIVDSIQAVFMQNTEAEVGGVTQIRTCATACVRLAKASQVPIILIGHVTKSGDVAGPQLLAHVVDVVLYFDSHGDVDSQYRWLTSTKNRFGPNETGVFQMTDVGCVPLSENSKSFTSQKPDDEGLPDGATWVFSNQAGSGTSSTRFVLGEIQVLTSRIPSGDGGQRARKIKTSGITFDRVEWLGAVLSKHCTGMEVLDRFVLFFCSHTHIFSNTEWTFTSTL